jgi:hypothetical protein
MSYTKVDRLSRSAENLRESLAKEVPGREQDWAEAVRSALQDVKQAFQDHRTSAEAPDGPLVIVNQPAPATMPTVSRRVQYLRQEHIELWKQVTDLEEQIQNALQVFKSKNKVSQVTTPLPVAPATGTVPEFGTIRTAGEKLIETLRQHQEAESLLVLDTVNTDIGVGD